MVSVIFGILIGLALFLILLDIFQVPFNETFRSIISMDRQLDDGESRINTSLEEVAIWVAKVIRLDEYKKASLEADLRAARMDHLTPERYVADRLVKSLIVGIWAIPAYAIWPLASFIILLAAALFYYNETKALQAKVVAQRKAIEFELSRLVFTIEKTLYHSRDVLMMLEEYTEMAGPELKRELQITTADMRSGNYENAIVRLETRIGSTMVSDVCRGLISIIRGDDTITYWQSLGLKFEDHRRELMKAKASRIPQRVNRLSMILLFCFMAVWFVVIGVQAFESMMVLFS